jgi:DNA sulfur modification protein DndD
LSFISSLIAKSKEQHLKDKKGSLFQGGLYPLVMDSPFGNLGKEYRRQVAMNIPKLADQVILLVSDSQWDDSVEKTTISKVGKMYESVFYTNKPIKESQKKFFKPSLDGGQYSTVKEVAL